MKRSVLAAAVLVSSLGAACAAEVVALGASNTAGRGGMQRMGVDKGQAFPAQLQALLASQGCKVRIANAGIDGDTTDNMLRRLPRSVQKDTKVLILQPGGNDARQGISGTAANVAAMQEFARSRGITVVMMERLGSLASSSNQTADGIHYTAAGHAQFAAALAPQVKSAACGR